jgi:hypothetical protein
VAESDVLNQDRAFSPTLGDNPNWNYGYTRKVASNKKRARPGLGRRYSRDTGNAGYSVSLNWNNRPFVQVQRLKQFYEQFANGYFTIIDWDGGGRHHVGNFVTEPDGVELANGLWTVQGLVFEEAAQARMLEYPADWTNSSHSIYAVDDYLQPLVATSSSLAGAWVAGLNPAIGGAAVNLPATYETLNATPVNGDFAQVEYVGWGFQMQFRTGAGMGVCDVYLDGAFVIKIDLSTGTGYTYLGGSALLVGGSTLASGLLTVPNVPLDKHRVKVVTPSVGAGGSYMSLLLPVAFPPVQVIH